METKLDLLEVGTEFKFETYSYRKLNSIGREGIYCQPKIGGVFQSARELLVQIPSKTLVIVAQG